MRLGGRLLFLAALLPVAAIAWAGCTSDPVRPDFDLAIVGATVIDGTGSAPREGVAILIDDGLIAAILPASEIDLAPGDRVIDASGKFVIPGLADMHVHLSPGGPVDASAERLMRQFLFYGVTTILNLGASNGDIGTIERLKRAEADGSLPGPHIYATGGLLTVPGSHPTSTIMRAPDSGDWTERGVFVVETPEQVRAAVDMVAEAGMDGVKIVVESGPTIFGGDNHPQMPPPLIRATVEEARTRGLPVFAHATSADELEDVVEAGVDAVVHLVTDPPPEPGIWASMATQNIYLVPTLSTFVSADVWGEPELNLADPFLRSGVDPSVLTSLLESGLVADGAPGPADWEWRAGLLDGLRSAHEAGVVIVAGSDTGNMFVFPGYSMHFELELLVEAGLSPMEALVSATRRAAELIGKEDEFGTLEPGKRADLLVLGSDPLRDIRNTRTLELVVRSGEVVDRAGLLAAE